MSIYVNKTLSVIGCPPALRSRIFAESATLVSCGLEARCLPWDGTRRDLVFIDPSQPIGESAFRISARRGTRIVVVGKRFPDAALDEHSDDTQIGTVLRLALGLDAACGRPDGVVVLPSGPDARSRATAPVETESEGDVRKTLLAQLAAPIRAGTDFWLRSGRESILVRPDAGQLFARHETSLGVLRAQLFRNLWLIEPAEPLAEADWPAHVASLESFLVDGCLRLQYKLPPVPCGAGRLTVFPDLGALSAHPDMLRVAREAMRGFASAEALAATTGVAVGRVNALLWAMHVTGLLAPLEESPAPPIRQVAPEPASPTLWQRMARRFGLLRPGADHA